MLEESDYGIWAYVRWFSWFPGYSLALILLNLFLSVFILFDGTANGIVFFHFGWFIAHV